MSSLEFAAEMSPIGNKTIKRKLTFSASALKGWSWLVHDIIGTEAGPRLCVIAGVHVNEVSSVEAALRLVSLFGSTPLKGIVSIMPIVNLPALPSRSQYVCPEDGKNINFSFPGRPDGSFSEAIADAILDWSSDAECLVDMHGGDLCENVARFTVVPTTGDPSFDAQNMQFAQAFEPQIIVRLPQAELHEPGRSCSGRARKRRHAAFAEAGANGLIDDASVAFHLKGVLRIARLLGMIDEEQASAMPGPTEGVVTATRYLWVRAAADGWCQYAVEPSDQVARGQLIATIRNYEGDIIQRIVSPDDGVILWRCTHAVVSAASDLFGIAA